MIKKARLIYNPTSGREEGKKRLADILQMLDAAGIETTTHATDGEGDATTSAAEAIDRGYDMIIAAGGDGTLNEVINGMAGKPERPPLGIIPLGTTNDFARALGIPRNWEEACSIITRQVTRVIDLGQANDKYFINIAGGGSLTELTYEVPSKLKTMIGQLAYYMKGLEKMTRLRPTELRIELDGHGVFHEEFMLFLITNTNSVGGFEKLAPDARIDDGLFDVIMLKKCNLAEFIRVAGMALRGEHVNDPLIIHAQTKRVSVTSPDMVQLNLDGEYGGLLPATFQVLPSHLRIFVDGE
ncbi:diacylglycerol kinase [Paenibacillus apiarius]|uniref:Diacylglycerol kinase n=1 Tax=Paenibacillus apiarius TaxID=46240 RepID=A0ABT4DZ51_9BACL|nr:diacylglycerol kinase [Paenibacillus apiarius]MBN3525051.1 diacylglycerol kinase [Paenibacillus apiarius]MCY9517950.1 diacylglycerol kinase [Paenibacillus apiarius]MCY9522621.1 diacylglycerol kinase [Paenibacillus apiarius]MCY9554517.1 diacylglycerol kinase [Paenibacillus apiarius]MCY9560717.1 diacylglycerol kinase [Paenibacillus apiarius]